MWLKQHRNASLELQRGTRLVGQINLSMKNADDRQVLVEFISELRKQMRLKPRLLPKEAKPSTIRGKIEHLIEARRARRRHLRRLASWGHSEKN